MSKVIDYDKIVRDSFIKAQRDLGILKEQAGTKASAFIEPFDKQKHMPAFQFKATEWGLKGSTDANQIDAIITAIVGNKADVAKDNLSKLKIVLEELNKNLGVEASAYAGLKNVPEEEQQVSSLRQIVASMQLKSLISSIIAQNPNAAGKIFEGLVARMVGGYSNNPIDNPIQDFVDGQGNYISLKTIKSTTEIKGSKANLAKGIAAKGAVTYLVCIKNADSDPFKMQIFSFKVNDKNFFYFINGVTSMYELTPELKDKIRADINGIYKFFKIIEPNKKSNPDSLTSAPKQPVAEATKPKKKSQQLDPSQEQPPAGVVQMDVINQYFAQESESFASMSDDQKIAEFQKRLKVVIDSINITDTEQEEYYDRAINFYKELAPKSISGPSVWKASYEDIKNSMFFKKQDADPFKAVTWNSLYYVVKKIKAENNKFALAAIFDKDANFREKAKKIYNRLEDGANFGDSLVFNELLKDVTNEHGYYVDKKDELGNKFNSFVNFIEKIEKAKKDANTEKFKQTALPITPRPLTDYIRGSIAAGQTPAKDAELEQELEVFWSKISTAIPAQSLNEAEETDTEETFDKKDDGDTEQKKVKGETQFELSVATVREFAIQNQKETEYDDSYPEVIVARTQLFNSAKKNGKLFENWAEPIYKSMHYLTQGINRYFLEDDIGGLSSKADKDNNIPGAMLAAEQLATDTKDIASKGLKASELTENKNNLNNLTKEARIVMEMLQRMED